MRGVRPQNSINDTREDHLRIETSYFDDEDRFDSELNSVYAHESEDENESIVENYYMSELADENWGKSAGKDQTTKTNRLESDHCTSHHYKITLQVSQSVHGDRRVQARGPRR